MNSRIYRLRILVVSPLLLIAIFFARSLFAKGIPIFAEPSAIQQTFRFDASAVSPKPKTVNLCGTFNNWSHTDTTMRSKGDGVYSITLSLAPGVYHYKFLVDGSRWFTDPAADKSLEDDDDHGNSGVFVGMDARQLSPLGPDDIDPRALAHDPASDADANVASPSLLRLRIRTAPHGVNTVIVHYRTAENPHWQQQPLELVDQTMGFYRYGTVISVAGSRVDYFFDLTHGQKSAYVGNSTLYPDRDSASANPYSLKMRPSFQTPDWATHAVWYQIFVERFRNGDPSNDPPNTKPWQSRWYSTLPGEVPGKENFYKANVFNRRYGGDLQGVREELPYLRQLGVTAIYLNPIFQADSAHKYDTRDYRHVDDFFAVKGSADRLAGETDDPSTWQWSQSDKVFLDLVADAHRQGFKVVIDGVFNHVGKSNPLFQDVLKNGKNSPHANWFEVIDWGRGGKAGDPDGLQYLSWNGKNGGMPLIKKSPATGLANGPRQYILAIARRWLAPDGDPSRGVDGFRLDAAQDIPHPFWVEFRKVVKSVKPDAYISGEIWTWAQPWLKGDQFDAVMNYQFAMAGQDFFANQKKAISPTEFDRRLNRLFYTYPLQVAFDQMNLYDSHDTDRVPSWFANPDRKYNSDDRLQEPRSTYDASKPSPAEWTRLRQAVDFQMTFVGAPMIYYGDEAGMWGPSDPSDRMPMWWSDLKFDDSQCAFDSQQFACYQRAIAARRQCPALQDGIFRRVLIDDNRGIYAFARDDGSQTAYVVLNRSERPNQVDLPVDSILSTRKFVNWLDPAEANLLPAQADQPQSRPTLQLNPGAQLFQPHNNVLSISLPAYGSAILAPSE